MAAVVVGVIAIGAVSVPTASAGLVKDAVDTVGSTVKSVQASPNAVPSLPSASPPEKAPLPLPKPPAPAGTPSPPPQAPVKPPSKESSHAPSQAGGGSANPHSEDIGGAARNVVDSVTSLGDEAAPGASPSGRRSKEDPATAPHAPGTAPQHRAVQGASEAVVRRSTESSGSPIAVRAAEVAALQRWFARVWPAVALSGGGVSGVGMVGAVVGDLFRPALVAVTGLLLASSPVLPTSGDEPLAGRYGVAGASRSAPAPSPPVTAAEGVKVVYLIVIAALLALLAFTVWREFRIALNPGLR